jgi:hypothetical protein
MATHCVYFAVRTESLHLRASKSYVCGSASQFVTETCLCVCRPMKEFVIDTDVSEIILSFGYIVVENS